ncbi:Transposase IS4 [Popillia japonica]|uniref:Transposase IS4 n=1 Tax=Popillia japonica TaxID=7064 RepID=A0AAW1L6X2_POPJA
MVPYFGSHFAKMFIKNKPVRFGFKIWCITSSDRYLYKCFPYGHRYLYKCFPYGRKQEVYSELGLGAQTLIQLLSIVENPSNHKVYFDNFFRYTLLRVLEDKGFHATGTVLENRTAKCQLETSTSIAKKLGEHLRLLAI